jgi:hypothetical protein
MLRENRKAEEMANGKAGSSKPYGRYFIVLLLLASSQFREDSGGPDDGFPDSSETEYSEEPNGHDALPPR